MAKTETRHLPSRSELTEECNAMSLPTAIQRGRALRREGFRIVHHGVFSDSVEIPGGEHFDEARLNVRYNMVEDEDKSKIEKAKEYLILCETMLRQTSSNQRGYELV